jgi:protocatechuate 3,4-dioxygenase beta subunit
MVTGSNGTYSFTNLGPGSYTVQEVVPAGWTQTGGIGGYTIVAHSGQNSTGDNFDDFQNVISISGTKYNDVNGTGVYCSGDSGLSGVTIDLFKNGGTQPVGTTVTGSNGSYSFTNLAAGTYTVKEVVPSGWVQTGTSSYTVTPCSGQSVSGLNFFDFQLICISGTKYNDITGNGFSSDDNPLGGVTIDLFKETNCTSGLQTGCPNGDTLVATTVTASNGTYSFCNLGPGTYYVQEVVPGGYIQTGGGPNGSAGCTYYTVNAQSGQMAGGENFDDFMIPTCQPQCVSFTVSGGGCQTQTVPDLRGNTQQGQMVTVTFTVTPGMNDTLSLVSYIAPASSFNSSTAYQQQIFDVASGTFGPGTHTLTVLLPNCNYQVDFICGQAINVLGPQTNPLTGNPYGPDSSNIYYSAQGRLLSADNEGSNSYSPQAVSKGDFGAASFWSTSTGQTLIKALNGSASATNLAQWLVTTMPNLYGSGTGNHALVTSGGAYYTNTQVAQSIASGYFTGNDLTTLSVALSAYVTSVDLAGSQAATKAAQDGFHTSADGSGFDSYSVGTNGAAFGVTNGTSLSVIQLLVYLNGLTTPGLSVSGGANAVFAALILAAS